MWPSRELIGSAQETSKTRQRPPLPVRDEAIDFRNASPVEAGLYISSLGLPSPAASQRALLLILIQGVSLLFLAPNCGCPRVCLTLRASPTVPLSTAQTEGVLRMQCWTDDILASILFQHLIAISDGWVLNSFCLTIESILAQGFMDLLASRVLYIL